MIRFLIASLALSVTSFAAPAASLTKLTWNFSGAAGIVNNPAVIRTVSDVTLTATALRFTLAPNMLISLGQTIAGVRIQATTAGIGVPGGASDLQLDTNQGGARGAFSSPAASASRSMGSSCRSSMATIRCKPMASTRTKRWSRSGSAASFEPG